MIPLEESAPSGNSINHQSANSNGVCYERETPPFSHNVKELPEYDNSYRPQQRLEVINHHAMDNNQHNHTQHYQRHPQAIPVNHHVNTYQHYIHTAPPVMSHIPVHFEDVIKEENTKKRRRTNYKDPENMNKLNAALNMLINQQDGDGSKDLKTVSKLYNLPYNTLRDNYLKATTGQVQKSKRERKPAGNSVKAQEMLMHSPNTMMQIQVLQQQQQHHHHQQLQQIQHFQHQQNQQQQPRHHLLGHPPPHQHLQQHMLTQQQKNHLAQQQMLHHHQHHQQYQQHSLGHPMHAPSHMFVSPHLLVHPHSNAAAVDSSRGSSMTPSSSVSGGASSGSPRLGFSDASSFAYQRSQSQAAPSHHDHNSGDGTVSSAPSSSVLSTPSSAALSPRDSQNRQLPGQPPLGDLALGGSDSSEQQQQQQHMVQRAPHMLHMQQQRHYHQQHNQAAPHYYQQQQAYPGYHQLPPPHLGSGGGNRNEGFLVGGLGNGGQYPGPGHGTELVFQSQQHFAQRQPHTFGPPPPLQQHAQFEHRPPPDSTAYHYSPQQYAVVVDQPSVSVGNVSERRLSPEPVPGMLPHQYGPPITVDCAPRPGDLAAVQHERAAKVMHGQYMSPSFYPPHQQQLSAPSPHSPSQQPQQLREPSSPRLETSELLLSPAGGRESSELHLRSSLEEEEETRKVEAGEKRATASLTMTVDNSLTQLSQTAVEVPVGLSVSGTVDISGNQCDNGDVE